MNLRIKIYITLINILFMIFPHFSYAAINSEIFSCYLTDEISKEDKSVSGGSNFNTKTPMIYLVCQSDQVNKGQLIKAVWIAVNTNQVAPDNYQIDEKSLSVTKKMADNEIFTANFSLSIPNKGWPKGEYKVELYVDNHLDQSLNFNIK